MDVNGLADVVSKAATRALAVADNMPMTEPCLRLYRNDANSVAIAVLRALMLVNSDSDDHISADDTGMAISKQQAKDVADALALRGRAA